MSKPVLSAVLLSLLTALALDRRAIAQTLDTFDFTLSSGWSVSSTTLTGSFSGYVEPDGLIELDDLTSFTLTYTQPLAAPPYSFPLDQSLGNLLLFSYDPTGGSSSLDFIANSIPSPATSYNICVGAATVFSPDCNSGRTNPGGAVAGLVLGEEELLNYSTDFVDITLVSSVTTSGPTTATPEPPTWMMLLSGFVGIGFVRAAAARRSKPLIPRKGGS